MIIIIFGSPGVGKTALLTFFAIMSYYQTQWSLLPQTSRIIDDLNASGEYSLSAPEHLIFSDYYISEPRFGFKPWNSYAINGHGLAIPALEVEVDESDFLEKKEFEKQRQKLMQTVKRNQSLMHLPPNAHIFLDEAQRYFNSRKSATFDEYVSRFFELHRHHGIQLFLSCQRSNLIDLNVRELAERVLLVDRMEHRIENGRVTQTTWHCKRFDDCFSASNYRESSGENGSFTREKFVFNGNIFAAYNSTNFAAEFWLNDRVPDFTLSPATAPRLTADAIKEYSLKRRERQ